MSTVKIGKRESQDYIVMSVPVVKTTVKNEINSVQKVLGEIASLHDMNMFVTSSDNYFAKHLYNRQSVADRSIARYGASARIGQLGLDISGIAIAKMELLQAQEIDDAEGIVRNREDLVNETASLLTSTGRFTTDIAGLTKAQPSIFIGNLKKVALGGYGLILIKKAYNQYERGADVANFIESLEKNKNLDDLFNLTQEEISIAKYDFYRSNGLIDSCDIISSKEPELTREQEEDLETKLDNIQKVKLASLERRVGTNILVTLKDKGLLDLQKGVISINKEKIGDLKQILITQASGIKKEHYIKSGILLFFGISITILWAGLTFSIASNPYTALVAVVYVLFSMLTVCNSLAKAQELYSREEWKELAVFLMVSALSLTFLILGLNIEADTVEGVYFVYLILYKSHVLENLRDKISEYFNEKIS